MGKGSNFLIQVYTDGGCSGNPGPGGWAFLIIRTYGPRREEGGGKKQVGGDGGHILLEEKWGAEESTTNNRMELQAVIAALEAVSRLQPGPLFSGAPGDEKVTVFTDSQYVQKGITEWIHAWKQKSWRTSGKKPVKNQDLWMKLDQLAAGIPLTWEWVRGHAGNEYNERCDALTQKAIACKR